MALAFRVMSSTIRTLLLTGVTLTLVGLVGLAWATTRPADAPAWVRYLAVPAYGVGALCLIGAGLWWLVRFTRQRDASR